MISGDPDFYVKWFCDPQKLDINELDAGNKYKTTSSLVRLRSVRNNKTWKK